MLFIGVRMIAGGALLLGYQYFFNRKYWRYESRDMVPFLQIIIFHIFIAYTGEFWALQFISGSKASLIYNISPFITALFAYMMFSERLTVRQWIGLAIGCIGLLPILKDQGFQEQTIFHVGMFSSAEIILLLAVISSAYGWIVMKHLLINRSYSSIMINGIGMMGGGILALMASFATEGYPVLRVAQHTTIADSLFMLVVYAGLLIIIANVVCYNLYSYLLARYSATFLSFAGFTTPLFAALFDWLLVGELACANFFLSMSIIIIGLILFYQDEMKQK
jgi:EamA-like transporter family.